MNWDKHTLNLVRLHAISEYMFSMSLSGVLDSLHNFFSSSTKRWEKLKETVGMVVNRSLDARWSARLGAVHVGKMK